MILSAHVADTPDPVTKYRDTVSPALEQLVMRCLEKKPADRWQSAEELMTQLEAIATPNGGMTPSTTRPVAMMATQKRKRIAWGGAATLTVIAAAVVILLLPSVINRGPRLDPGRVVVIPLENRTGDATLDDLGVMAADWIGQALQQVDMVEVVPAAYARQYSEQALSEGSRDLVSAVADRTSAGLVVSGTFFDVADSLQFRVEIIDVNRVAPLQVVDEAWLREERREAINVLGRRVSGALAYELDPYLARDVQPLPAPPRLEAYREMRLGYAAADRGDGEEALEHHLTAYALDTTLIQAVVGAAYVGRNPAQTDSLARFADERRFLLSRVEQANLDYLLAMLEHYSDAMYRAGREMARLDPVRYAPAHALGAIPLNRPQKALDALASWDPYAEWNRGDSHIYWGALASALHMLGDHEQELVEARRAREQHPGDLDMLGLEVNVLAALGRVRDVNELLDEALVLSQDPISAFIGAGTELRAHGSLEASRDVFERAVAWLEARPAEESEEPGFRWELAHVLYGAERWEEALELNRIRGTRAGVGLCAARMGDTATALEISAQLAELDMPGNVQGLLIARASLAAVLGQHDEAMRLLREALLEGHYDAHHDFDFESLWDREDFKELVRPKG
jgi:hypothetical protein